jgi:hypothetical protein
LIVELEKNKKVYKEMLPLGSIKKRKGDEVEEDTLIIISHDVTEPMKLVLAHTVVFVGSIWKNKSGWFLIVLSMGLTVATDIVLTAGVHHWFSTSTQDFHKINPAWRHRTNETLPCPYSGVCWIHMEE